MWLTRCINVTFQGHSSASQEFYLICYAKNASFVLRTGYFLEFEAMCGHTKRSFDVVLQTACNVSPIGPIQTRNWSDSLVHPLCIHWWHRMCLPSSSRGLRAAPLGIRTVVDVFSMSSRLPSQGTVSFHFHDSLFNGAFLISNDRLGQICFLQTVCSLILLLVQTIRVALSPRSVHGALE